MMVRDRSCSRADSTAVTTAGDSCPPQVEARRRGNQARLIAYLREHRCLREDLAADEATDIVGALTGYDVYRALVVEQRWPADRYQNWLADTLAYGVLARGMPEEPR